LTPRPAFHEAGFLGEMINYLSRNATLYRDGVIAVREVEVIRSNDDVIVIGGSWHNADDLNITNKEITSKITDAWSVAL
jgi:hypothetical protein